MSYCIFLDLTTKINLKKKLYSLLLYCFEKSSTILNNKVVLPAYIRGGPFSPIYLKIGDRLDAQVFLDVVLYDKKENVLKKFQN